MKIGNTISRASSNSTYVKNTMFVNDDFHYSREQGRLFPGTVASMRNAAKRFVKSEQFVQGKIYSGHIEKRKWVFTTNSVAISTNQEIER